MIHKKEAAFFGQLLFYNLSSISKSKEKTTLSGGLFFGAAGRIRTADLILTKDALYRLSYSSINNPAERELRGMATEKGLEPSTSSVTG